MDLGHVGPDCHRDHKVRQSTLIRLNPHHRTFGRCTETRNAGPGCWTSVSCHGGYTRYRRRCRSGSALTDGEVPPASDREGRRVLSNAQEHVHDRVPTAILNEAFDYVDGVHGLSLAASDRRRHCGGDQINGGDTRYLTSAETRRTMRMFKFEEWEKIRMARKPKVAFDESQLKKGEVRKLNALRKSLGEEIANQAFAEWIVSQPETVAEIVDKNAESIAEVLVDQINQGKLRIPRGGYLVRRGRGRVIVERASELLA